MRNSGKGCTTSINVQIYLCGKGICGTANCNKVFTVTSYGIPIFRGGYYRWTVEDYSNGYSR